MGKSRKQSEDPKVFDRQKLAVMESSDLSRKGNFDKDIREMLVKMNSHNDYFSLSSCSGRIIIFRQQTTSKGPVGVSKKKGCDWILVSHDPVDPEKAWISLQDFHSPDAEDKPDADVEAAGLEEHGVVTLKFEPFILHVQCRDTESAKLLHTQSIESGFRNSGLTLGKNGKLVLAVRSSHGLEVPLSDPATGQLLVDKNYVVFLTKLANDKLAENLKRIKLFEDRCSKFVWIDETPNEKELSSQRELCSTRVSFDDKCQEKCHVATLDPVL